MLKIVVFAPMPNAIVSAAVMVNPGDRRSMRAPKRRSPQMPASPRPSRAPSGTGSSASSRWRRACALEKLVLAELLERGRRASALGRALAAEIVIAIVEVLLQLLGDVGLVGRARAERRRGGGGSRRSS